MSGRSDGYEFDCMVAPCRYFTVSLIKLLVEQFAYSIYDVYKLLVSQHNDWGRN